MSYTTAYDDLTRVDRELSIPALDVTNNFFPVDAVDNGNNRTVRKGTSANNEYVIKKDGTLPAVVSFKSYNTKKVTTSPYIKPTYPSVSKGGQAFQFKTERYDRVVDALSNTYDEPIVVLTQVFRSDGSPINTGDLVLKALEDHLASVVSLGASTDLLSTKQLDRLAHGGAAPSGLIG